MIAIHVFWYRVFVGSAADNGNNGIGNIFGGDLLNDGAIIMAAEGGDAKMTSAEARSH